MDGKDDLEFVRGKKLNYFPQARWFYAVIEFCPDCKRKTLQYVGKDDKHYYLRCTCRGIWRIELKNYP